MAKRGTKDFLDLLLSNEEIDKSDIDELRRLSEGQLLEFKSGATALERGEPTLKAKRTVRKLIREYVGGFANTDGGILVIGVSEKEAPEGGVVDGVHVHNETNLSQWVTTVLAPMATQLHPYPKVSVVEYTEDVSVLLIAVPPAGHLVPNPDRKPTGYDIRVGDQTRAAPESYVADVLFGRRQRALFRVFPRFDKEEWVQEEVADSGARLFCRLWIELSIENISLVDADRVVVGAIAWTAGSTDPQRFFPTSLHPYIRSVLPTAGNHQLVHLSGGLGDQGETRDLPPFGLANAVLGPFEFPRMSGLVRMALYVRARGATPTWFEVCARTVENARWDVEHPTNIGGKTYGINVTRMFVTKAASGGPRVAWEVDQAATE